MSVATPRPARSARHSAQGYPAVGRCWSAEARISADPFESGVPSLAEHQPDRSRPGDNRNQPYSQRPAARLWPPGQAICRGLSFHSGSLSSDLDGKNVPGDASEVCKRVRQTRSDEAVGHHAARSSVPAMSSRIGQSGRSSPWQAWISFCSVARIDWSSRTFSSMAATCALAISRTSWLARLLSW